MLGLIQPSIMRFMQWWVISSPEIYTMGGATSFDMSRPELYRDAIRLERPPANHCHQQRMAMSKVATPLRRTARESMTAALSFLRWTAMPA